MFLDINMSFLLLFVTLEVLSNRALTILLRISLFLMQVDHDAFKPFKSLRDEKGVLTTVEVSEVPPSADIGSFIMNDASLETHIKDPPSIDFQSSSMDDSESTLGLDVPQSTLRALAPSAALTTLPPKSKLGPATSRPVTFGDSQS